MKADVLLQGIHQQGQESVCFQGSLNQLDPALNNDLIWIQVGHCESVTRAQTMLLHFPDLSVSKKSRVMFQMFLQHPVFPLKMIPLFEKFLLSWGTWGCPSSYASWRFLCSGWRFAKWWLEDGCIGWAWWNVLSLSSLLLAVLNTVVDSSGYSRRLNLFLLTPRACFFISYPTIWKPVLRDICCPSSHSQLNH